jgi:gluconolactonase
VRIDRVHPDLDQLVPSAALPTVLFDDLSAGEGPVWDGARQRLLFTDHRESRLYQWSEGAGVRIVAKETNHGNGAARDAAGRIVLCTWDGLVAVTDDGARTPVAPAVEGRPFKVTIDVAVHSSGRAYFGGSTTGSFVDAGMAHGSDGSVEFIEPRVDDDGVVRSGFAVFAVPLDRPGEVTEALTDVLMPNGLAFSPDESILYMVDTRAAHVRALPVRPDGRLDSSEGRVFFDFSGVRATGLTDGITVDAQGNVYCAAPGGVWIIDPRGRHLGTICLGADEYHTNCAFGGPDRRTLFITTHRLLASVVLSASGAGG